MTLGYERRRPTEDAGVTRGGKSDSIFTDLIVYKDPARYRFFASLGIPSYLRDWLIMRLADESGHVDADRVQAYVHEYLPRREQFELIKSEMVRDGKRVRMLAKVRVEQDVKTGEAFYSLPDFGFPARRVEALVDGRLLRDEDQRQSLLGAAETWGVVDLEWQLRPLGDRAEEGRIVMVGFRPFRPYRVDLGFYQEAREEFSLDEWVDLLLTAIDYNPAAFYGPVEKLSLLARLLPFAEKRLNLIELAPKGTGKSTVFSQISKHGWLMSGGSVGRVSLFYNKSRRLPGLVSR